MGGFACSLYKNARGSNPVPNRRAPNLPQAELGLKNFSEGVADCKKVLQLDAENRDAKVLLRQALAGQKEAEKKYKAVYASILAACYV